MTTDLKAAAEAAQAATAAYIADPTDRETGRQWDRACAEFSLACTEDATLALIRERDEARKERDDLAQSLKHIMVADRDAAEAALSAAREEVGRYKAGITQIAAHLANAGRGEETTNERILDRVDEVLSTLTKEPHHG